MIKTIIVEDDPMVAQINRRYLDTANDIQVAAEFNNGKDALAYIETEEPDLVILDFAGSGDDFQVSDEEINIGISVRKGNTVLVDAINSYLSGKTADDFNALMEEAIKIQPLSE